MKLVHALPVIFLMSVFALNTRAEEYKAPKFKWNKSRSIPTPRAVQAEDFKDYGENKYRVQENPYKEREIASEDKKKSRDPSSTKVQEEGPQQPEVENFKPVPSPRSWKYHK